jgi:tripartite-type tricarboxylate transporter receptor subunit TctC
MVGQLFVGVFVRSGTPKPALDLMAATNQKVMADAEFQKILVSSGLEPINDTPDEARKFIADEQARWAPVVKAIGLKVG